MNVTVYRRLVQDARVSHGAFRLWHYLRDRANSQSQCWPGQRTIAGEMHCKPHSLKEWVGQLTAAGYLRTERVGQRHNLRYTILDGATPRVAERGNTKHVSRCPFRHVVLPKEATPRVAQKGNVSNTKEVNPMSKIPECLDSPEFAAVWSEWQEYRLGLRSKPKNPDKMFAEQLRFLAAKPADAIEILRQSIRNGWQGLFPLKRYEQRLTEAARKGQPI